MTLLSRIRTLRFWLCALLLGVLVGLFNHLTHYTPEWQTTLLAITAFTLGRVDVMIDPPRGALPR